MINATRLNTADAHVSLRDQIAQAIGIAPGKMTRSRCRPWSSLRFSGTRHEFLFACDHPIGAEVASRIRAHEFALHGEIVADASVAMSEGGCCVEALTVEAR